MISCRVSAYRVIIARRVGAVQTGEDNINARQVRLVAAGVWCARLQEV